MRASPLARSLFVVYVLLVVYASLYPLSGWSDQGLSAFAYLTAPRPRYITAFDVAANLVGYLPYGFFCVLALYPRLRGRQALVVAALSGAALSMVMEAAQSFLPTRVPSNLDVACNLAGALVGAAVGTHLAAWLLDQGPLKRLRRRVFLAGHAADLGLVVIALWLFTQLYPAMLLFGAAMTDASRATATRFAAVVSASIEMNSAAGWGAPLGALTRPLRSPAPKRSIAG